MARNNGNSNPKVTGKVRFIMLEAEIEDGNLSEIAQAISAAVRPATIVQRVIETPVNNLLESRSGKRFVAAGADTPEILGTEQEVEEVVQPPSKPKRTNNDRKPFKGKPDDTIEWDGNEVSFATYMKQKSTDETSKRYLAITAWFKIHGGRDSVDGNIFWNAYRMLGMTPLSDITQPCRHAVEAGYMSQPSRGQYAITKIGMGIVDNLNGDKSGSD